MSEDQKALEDAAISKLATLLAKRRWEDTTAQERSAVAVKLNEIRWSKARRAKRAGGTK